METGAALPEEMGAEEGHGPDYGLIGDELGHIFFSEEDRLARWRAGYQPFQSQELFHSSTNRYKGFSGPIGSGKSLALCREALKLADANPGRVGVIGAPTYPMLRDATQRAFFEIAADAGIPYDFLKSENSVTIRGTGSKILFRALDQFERIRGTNLAWFAVDELTYCKPEAWLRLEGRLRDNKAAARHGIAAWTPKGFDWVYRRFIAPDEHLDDYRAILAKPGENTALPSDFYDSLKSSYDEKFFRQEALGEYLSIFAGQVYHAFLREQNVEPCKYNPLLPLRWSLDFNVNPMCSVIGQIHEQGEEWRTGSKRRWLRILDEIVLADSNTPAACEEFAKRAMRWYTGRPIQVYLYGDASGNSRQTAGTTDWNIVREWFKGKPQFQLYWRVPAGNPLVKTRTNAVNGLLCNYAHERNLLIDPKCQELIRDFEQVAWAVDATGRTTGDIDKTQDHMRTHTSDAAGYLIETEFGLTQGSGFKSTVIA